VKKEDLLDSSFKSGNLCVRLLLNEVVNNLVYFIRNVIFFPQALNYNFVCEYFVPCLPLSYAKTPFVIIHKNYFKICSCFGVHIQQYGSVTTEKIVRIYGNAVTSVYMLRFTQQSDIV